ncbi:MAG: transglycosylase domain-containing protein [Rubricoccaceae bacterium]
MPSASPPNPPLHPAPGARRAERFPPGGPPGPEKRGTERKGSVAGAALRAGGRLTARAARRATRGLWHATRRAYRPGIVRLSRALRARAPLPPRARVAQAALGLAQRGAAGLGTALLLLVLTVLVLWPLTPGAGALRTAHAAQPAIAVSADGVELTRFDRLNRDWVALEDVAPPVIDALIATEDRRFYRHGGIDWYRTLGAALRTALGDRQGGSTITQQLARNLYPEEIGRRASLGRKLKEAVTAVKIEAVHDKDDILEIYLNTVPFLYEAYGIEMAARTYFGRSAATLDTTQAALLVGMLKGTSYYNPVRNPERALERRNVVLGLMAREGHIPPQRLEALRAVPLRLQFARQPVRPSRAPHFTEHVRAVAGAWAARNGYSLHADGLVIHTTLDYRLQQAAEQAVRTFGDALQAVADVEWGRAHAGLLGRTTTPYQRAARATEPFAHFWAARPDVTAAFIRESAEFARARAAGADSARALDSLRADPDFMRRLRQAKTRLEIGLTAIDPRTGAVRVWVGGRDLARGGYDHVARAQRQPGSTFKPFVFARALEEGYTPEDRLRDTDVEILLTDGSTWRPSNAGTISGEEMTLRAALEQSTNTVAAQLVERVGPRDVARVARRMGVVQSRLEAVPSIALGTSEVTLLEMTSAFATIADEGRYRAPLVISRIEDREGNVLATFEAPPRQALAPDVSLTLLDMMRGVVTRGTARRVRSDFGVRGDLAGKTGTTQDGADGWFLLMHPELVAGAWVGFDDPRVTFRSTYWEQGGNNALRVVGDFFRTAQRQGLVSPRAAFPPAPEIQRRGFVHRLETWIADAVGSLRGAPAPDAPPSSAAPDRPDPRVAAAREGERDAERQARDLAARERRERREAERALERARQAEDSLRTLVLPSANELRRRLRDAERLASDALGETNPAVREALRAAAQAAADEARLLLEDIERGRVQPQR